MNIKLSLNMMNNNLLIKLFREIDGDYEDDVVGMD